MDISEFFLKQYLTKVDKIDDENQWATISHPKKKQIQIGLYAVSNRSKKIGTLDCFNFITHLLILDKPKCSCIRTLAYPLPNPYIKTPKQILLNYFSGTISNTFLKFCFGTFAVTRIKFPSPGRNSNNCLDETKTFITSVFLLESQMTPQCLPPFS